MHVDRVAGLHAHRDVRRVVFDYRHEVCRAHRRDGVVVLRDVVDARLAVRRDAESRRHDRRARQLVDKSVPRSLLCVVVCDERLDGVHLALVEYVRVENRAARIDLAFADEADAFIYGERGVDVEASAHAGREVLECIFSAAERDVALGRVEAEVLEKCGGGRIAGKPRLAHDGRIPQKSRLAAVGRVDDRHRLRGPDFGKPVRRHGQRFADTHRFDVFRPLDRPRPLHGLAVVVVSKPRDWLADLVRIAVGEVEAVLVRVVHVNRNRSRASRPDLVLAVREGGRHVADIVPVRLGKPGVVEEVERMGAWQDRPRRHRIRKRGIDFVRQKDGEVLHRRPAVGDILHEDAWLRGVD